MAVKKKFSINTFWILIAMVALIFPRAQINKAKADNGDCAISITGAPSVLSANYGLTPGQSGSLAWFSTGCYYMELVYPGQQSGMGSTVATQGYINVGPYNFHHPYYKTYTVEGMGNNGQSYASFTFYLTQTVPVCDITGFNASSTTINLGSSVNLSWTSTNCTALNINGISVAVPYGTTAMTPDAAGTTTYIISDGAGHSLSRTILVADPNVAQGCTFTSFGPDPNYINASGSASVTWATSGTNCNVSLRATSGAGYAYYDQGEPNFGTKTISGAHAGDVWTLSYGGGQSASIVMRGNDNCSIASFTASPATFSLSGDAVSLIWSAPWCTTVTLRGGEFGSGTNVTANGTSSGSITAHPTATTIYYLDAFSTHNSALTSSATATMSGGGSARVNINATVNGKSVPASAFVYGFIPSGLSSLPNNAVGTFSNLSPGNYTVVANTGQDGFVHVLVDGKDWKAAAPSDSQTATSGQTINLNLQAKTHAVLQIQ